MDVVPLDMKRIAESPEEMGYPVASLIVPEKDGTVIRTDAKFPVLITPFRALPEAFDWEIFLECPKSKIVRPLNDENIVYAPEADHAGLVSRGAQLCDSRNITKLGFQTPKRIFIECKSRLLNFPGLVESEQIPGA